MMFWRVRVLSLFRRTTWRDVLMAPSIEEVYGYEPRDSTLDHLGAVNVVVRNSLLEEAHANGPVTADDIRHMTTAAVAPMSHLLAAGRRPPWTRGRGAGQSVCDASPRVSPSVDLSAGSSGHDRSWWRANSLSGS